MAVHRAGGQDVRLAARALRVASSGQLLEGKTGEHLMTVRVYDRYENVGVAKTVLCPARRSLR